MPASGCFCGSATQHHFQLGRLQAHGPFCSRPLSCCYTGADSPAEVDAAQPLLKRGDAAAADVIVPPGARAERRDRGMLPNWLLDATCPSSFLPLPC